MNNEEVITTEDLLNEMHRIQEENDKLMINNEQLKEEINELHNSYTQLRHRLNKKVKIKNYYKIQSTVFKTGLSGIGVSLTFITIIGMGIERLDYNYNGWFNTNCIMMYTIGMVLILFPFIINIISSLYDEK